MGAFDIKVRVVVRTKVLCVLTAALSSLPWPQLPKAAQSCRAGVSRGIPTVCVETRDAGGRALAPSPPLIGFPHSPYFEVVAVIKMARC